MRARIEHFRYPTPSSRNSTGEPRIVMDKYTRDERPPFRLRVFLPEFTHLNPLALPWDVLRRDPDKFPQWQIAKISSARTVVGLDYQNTLGQVERIYIKRSILLGRVKQVLSRFRSSKEWREFQHADEFGRAGITVPDPVYYSEAVIESQPVVFYATRALSSNWKEVKCFFKATRHFGEEWRSLARYTRTLHARGILHGDYRGDHIYFDPARLADGGDKAWCLIDLDGSRADHLITEKDRFRALAQLTESLLTSGIEMDNVAEFLDLYDPDGKYHLDAERIYNYTIEKVRNKAPHPGMT